MAEVVGEESARIYAKCLSHRFSLCHVSVCVCACLYTYRHLSSESIVGRPTRVLGVDLLKEECDVLEELKRHAGPELGQA